MEKQCVDQIITEYMPKLYGFSIKKSFSYEEAEELCSDIIHEVYISLLQTEDIFNLEGYIWRISEHTYSKYVSHKKKHLGVSLDQIQLAFWDRYSVEMPEDESKRLRREIAFLTEKRRLAVFYFYYENQSIAWIANELHLPIGTVKWHLNQARMELKEGFSMERKIGKLGLSPIKACDYGHSGNPGSNSGPEFYLGDPLNLNIVYSVYHTPRTKEGIAEELGLTLVFIEDKINFLEENGFLVKTTGNQYTTYVHFSAETYSRELEEKCIKLQLSIAETLASEYVPLVRAAIQDVKNVYIPGGNRELLEAAAVFYGISEKCRISCSRNISKYVMKTTAGGEFSTDIIIDSKPSDPDYQFTLSLPSYHACGSMTRVSDKYPVFSWSIDTRLDSRTGYWQNNLCSDYDYLYEWISGAIHDDVPNREKINRLRERRFLGDDNSVKVMMVAGKAEDFFAKVPALSEEFKQKFADTALEMAMQEAKNFPPQMQDLIISKNVCGFISSTVAIMVMDILYENGTFQPLTEQEKITANLIMFTDKLPAKQ